VERARIILLAATGQGVDETARQLGVWRKTVGHWRGRWRDADPVCSVAQRLSDAPRSGAPAKFTPEGIRQIVGISSWSVYEAADTVAEQGGETVSLDEMTGIHALERAAKTLLMKRGHVERREFEYKRHGTRGRQPFARHD
jgi:transposase